MTETTARTDAPAPAGEASPAAGLPGATEPGYDVTTPLDIDYYEAFADLPAADRAVWERARAAATAVQAEFVAAWDRHEYPVAAAAGLGRHGLFNDGLDHPELERFSPLATGLVNMELSRVDGSLGTVLAVQGGLALRTLVYFGSEEQQRQYVGPLARGEVLGAFALTEPDHGSDSAGLETRATRTERGWVLRGAKKWIGNGASGGITFVWARVEDPGAGGGGAGDHGAVRCFLVPQDTRGYRGEVIAGKGALRAIDQAVITLDDVELPAEALLPGARTFKDASRVLYATRAGVAWSALGHATACFESALAYATQRVQFGKRLAQHQLVQERLTRMLSQLVSMQLYCVGLADLEAAGRLRPTQASLAKYHNTRTARAIAAEARDLLGGNGILLEHGVIRHQADIEAIHTYEGTESVQALLIGRDLTGYGAFA
ncbi:acyl-CoA dehydrogenase [Citricoccus sp. SGAir0253]|uniref:acyl-CoA dehydrogenase family protein n=1 Tax=Citricoccus sp. SGAir0253 TaxID=2567881 RepID=UPI0010CCF9E1|nr:acyl-CoA dehydrogenase family protein [Citricoccus sp. SGAir0253]QCU77208.1 acyl-CoA dehydrogenase [Citricoccus sp. SGAir0253]